MTPAKITIVGAPTAASDDAIARYLERFLRTERPGTTWTASREVER